PPPTFNGPSGGRRWAAHRAWRVQPSPRRCRATPAVSRRCDHELHLRHAPQLRSEVHHGIAPTPTILFRALVSRTAFQTVTNGPNGDDGVPRTDRRGGRGHAGCIC